jgi:exopolyphosphatase/pppGpp-phosphohydrolase
MLTNPYKSVLGIDIGGGSTEFIYGINGVSMLLKV